MKTETDKILFEGQREGEELLLVFRKHIISMRKGFYLFFAVFAISCLPTFIFLEMWALWWAVAGFFLGFLVFGWHFMKWYFSIWLLTTERIRQISQKGLFSKEVMDLPLSKIQSVNYRVGGFFAEVFSFGTLNILTIVGDLTIQNIEKPEKIYNQLQDILGEIKQEEYGE